MLTVARAWKIDMKIGADSPGILAEDHDAIAQQNRFLNVVRNDEHGAGGHFLVLPQLQQFAAKVLGGQNIQRREWFIHEQHFGFHHQRAREAHALFHAAGQLFWIGALEAVQAHRVEHLDAARSALVRRNAAGFQRRFHVFQNSEPGKQREALEDDGYVLARTVDGRAVPEHLAGRGLRKAGKNSEQRGFARARGPEQRQNLVRIYSQVQRAR